MQEFLELFSLPKEVIAAGVSGGADSLALVLRLKEAGCTVVALTVDHKLRPESGREADYVAKLMRQFGIEHHILTWEGKKPTRAIEAEAREARYHLLCGWCREHGIKFLAVGHHRRDQAETFLLRLQRGSGLYGLCGMLPSCVRDGVQIIRPQLDDTPEKLRDYLRGRGIKWVEDPSNQCTDFQRVKMRKFLPELEKETGISEERLAETAKVLLRTRTYFQEEVNDKITNRVRQWGRNVFSWAPVLFSAMHEEIGYRVLIDLLCRAGGRNYAPEAEEVLRLVKALKRSDFKGCTLGGCEIFTAQKRVWLVPEASGAEVLSKAEWEKCLQTAPQYAKANLPYKVRRALYAELMKVEDGQKS